jgi:sulfatase modifying factor 1
MAKYQIEVTEVQEGGGCGSVILFCIVVFIILAMMGKLPLSSALVALVSLWLALAFHPCPDDMVSVKGFCIDRYEAPNRRGATPLVMQSLVDAEAFCLARGKRICREREWQAACHSIDHRRWSRGQDSTACNNRHPWVPFDINRFAHPRTQADEVARLLRASPSGAFPRCRTPEGVFDLDGNVEEWVLSDNPASPWRGTLKGGFWAKPFPTCEASNDVHEPTFRFYETGFRCCADPK